MTYTMTIAMEEGEGGGVTTGEVIEGPTEEATEEETAMGTEIILPTMIMEEVVAIVVKDAVIIGRTIQATMIEDSIITAMKREDEPCEK
jgi:hypothetical protein